MSCEHINPTRESGHAVPEVATRRDFLKSGAAISAAVASSVLAPEAVAAGTEKYADPAKPMLPRSTMKLDLAGC